MNENDLKCRLIQEPEIELPHCSVHHVVCRWGASHYAVRDTHGRTLFNTETLDKAKQFAEQHESKIPSKNPDLPAWMQAKGWRLGKTDCNTCNTDENETT